MVGLFWQNSDVPTSIGTDQERAPIGYKMLRSVALFFADVQSIQLLSHEARARVDLRTCHWWPPDQLCRKLLTAKSTRATTDPGVRRPLQQRQRVRARTHSSRREAKGGGATRGQAAGRLAKPDDRADPDGVDGNSAGGLGQRQSAPARRLMARVRQHAAARADLLDHYLRLAQEAGKAMAERFLDRAEASFTLVAEQPKLGSPLSLSRPELAAFASGASTDSRASRSSICRSLMASMSCACCTRHATGGACLV
jgi:plasmid stabilization system protein ParE